MSVFLRVILPVTASLFCSLSYSKTESQSGVKSEIWDVNGNWAVMTRRDYTYDAFDDYTVMSGYSGTLNSRSGNDLSIKISCSNYGDDISIFSKNDFFQSVMGNVSVRLKTEKVNSMRLPIKKPYITKKYHAFVFVSGSAIRDVVETFEGSEMATFAYYGRGVSARSVVDGSFLHEEHIEDIYLSGFSQGYAAIKQFCLNSKVLRGVKVDGKVEGLCPGGCND
jgi:hypothetical protein